MWKFLRKKSYSEIPFFKQMKKDMHSHLLPGIDDGSPDVETSIDFIRRLSDAGLREFICTPHIFGDMFRNNEQIINDALYRLRNAIHKEGLDVKISAAAEYMLDDYFMDLLRSGTPLLTLNGSYLLTEFPFSIPPFKLEEITFEIHNLNYQPILAHPERYAYFHRKPEMYSRMKDLGFLLQINLLSLTGQYGRQVRNAAKYLVRQGLVDLVGTDLHHEGHLEMLLDPRSQKIFKDNFGDRILNDF